jgi:hypothetical protein
MNEPTNHDPGLDELEAALYEQQMLPVPPDLVTKVLAGLPGRRRALSWPALARMAAAVLVALGTWIGAVGTAPALAEVEAPSFVEEALAPAQELLPSSALEVPTLELSTVPLASSAAEGAGAGGLALAGLAVLGFGLVLARRMNRHAAVVVADDEEEIPS